ncbi:MAG: FIST C-terminal domain-containing protein [Deltaproteobacteria bacterium]|nr:FIST C-terminal domain-containing protein [Deltaproteobacteria bacterium]
MIRFYSANVRIANSQRAIDECFDIAFGGQVPDDLRAVIINAPLGHKLDRLAASVRQKAGEQNYVTLGSSCSGVTGRDGVGESMSDLAMMAVCGPQEEFAYAGVDDIFGHNSYEKGLELARALHDKAPDATIIYLLCPGIDIANDLVVNAFEETFGKEITIFGGTSSDNMRGLVSQQYTGEALTEHGAWAAAFNDASLKAVTRATHGFTAYGEPMIVTKADGNKIIEFDGRPAWTVFTDRLGLKPAPDTICGETIPVGALAEELPEALAQEYGNQHILRVITKYDSNGTIHYPATVQAGTKLWLTQRDEDLIFSEQERSLEFLKEQIGAGVPVAVFQTDCLARGRFLFNKVIKDEIIAMMHQALSNGGVVPAWLGMYGFGEYAILGGRNTFHNYSTALLVLYR